MKSLPMMGVAMPKIGILIIVVLIPVSSVLRADTNSADTVRLSTRASATTPIFVASAISSKAPFTPRRTVKVCKSDCDYKSPSEAMANAQDYDLIEVEAGAYADCA